MQPTPEAALLHYLQQHTAITDAQWSELLPLVQVRSVKKGTILLKQEAICSEVFFVADGLLRSYTVDDQGKEHILQFGPEHWLIADRNSFYYQQPALFFVDAIEDSSVVLLEQSFFDRAEAIVPGFVKYNMMALHNSIRYMQRRINQLLAADAEERYLDFINLYPNVTLRVPQWMIASYLGITPESLSRVRKELARRNFKAS
jgi:CRP-like cAMP-binding protein